MAKTYDVIIIGGGPAGLSAGIYAKRFGLEPLVIVKETGGLVATAPLLENWPGEKSITGFKLSQKMEKQARKLKVKIVVDSVEKAAVGANGRKFEVQAVEKGYSSRALILATGTKHKHLGVPGESEFEGKGVSYCATCDGPLFTGKAVAVVGGGDSAVKTALLLAGMASKVYLIYRGGALKCDAFNRDSVCSHDKVKVIYETNITKITGEKMVSKIELDKPFEGSDSLAVQGVFISVGHVPSSELAVDLGATVNDKGEVIVDKVGKTAVPGLFAAGDVTDFGFRQAITAAAQGATAAHEAYSYVSRLDAEKK
ncbi:MAG: FAD-dependent oxidoreductase [Candidatus Micrarchaeia archaeon]